jgi:hypothetical protein
MPDRIDASMHRVKPACGHSVIDRPQAKPKRHELAASNNAVLAGRKRGDLRITRAVPTWATFTMYFGVNVAHVRQ